VEEAFGERCERGYIFRPRVFSRDGHDMVKTHGCLYRKIVEEVSLNHLDNLI